MVEKKASFNNVDIYTLDNEKFKQSVIKVLFIDTKSRERMYRNRLLLNVLRRATEKYDTNLKINRKLEELYGTEIAVASAPLGNLFLSSFTAYMVDDRFLPDSEKIFGEVAEMLLDMICNPYTENGGFSSSIVKREKKNIRLSIKSENNDKMTVCCNLVRKEAFKNDIRGITPPDILKEERNVDEKTLYEYYKNVFLREMNVKIFVSSSSDAEIIKNIMETKGYFRNTSAEERKIVFSEYTERKTVRKTHREQGVTQCKMNILFKNAEPGKVNYHSKLFMTYLLGGTESSLLFRNVREKESMAYSIYAIYNSMDDTVSVRCGINEKNKNQVRKLILEAIQAIREGKFTDEDMNLVVETRRNRLKGITDSQQKEITRAISGSLFGYKKTPEESFNVFSRVTRENIMEAAGCFIPDVEVTVCGTKKKEDKNGKL